MSRPIEFRRAARIEFDDAADWYDVRRESLGLAFKDAVRKVLRRIAKQPDYYSVVWSDVREAPVSGFPYCVYYLEELERIIVLSIFHTSRDPSVWQSRI